MRLSIAMIVKNEEKYLEKCLLSTEKLKGKIDYELIIIDTGSTDTTIDIAKKFTDKVYEAKWNNDFSYMRNLSISYCSGDWILILDADEVIENIDELVSILSDRSIDEFNSIGIYQKNFLSGMDQDNYSITSVFRLLKRNSEFRFEGTIHEQPNIIYPRKESSITLLHYGYNNSSFEKLKYRNERNKKLLLKELKCGNMDKIYVLFQLARTFINENDNSRAFRCITRAYNMDKDVDGVHIVVYKQYVNKLFSKGEYERCIQILDEVKEYFKEDLDYYYYNAMSYLKIKDYDVSEKFFNGYFNLYEKKEQGKLFISQTGEDSLKCFEGARINFAICLFKQKKYDKVISIYDCLKNDIALEKLSREYIYSIIMTENFNLVKNYLEINYSDDKMNDVAYVLDDLFAEDFDLKRLIGINQDLDKYICLVYLDNTKYELNKLDLSKYYLWKAKVVRKCILNDSSNLIYLEGLNIDDTYKYINYLSFNYNTIDVLLDYENANYLNTDNSKRSLVYSIQKVLIYNKLIAHNKYYNLIKQTFVSNCIFLFDDLISERKNNISAQYDFIEQVLDKYNLLWIYIFRVLKNINISESISGIKRILKTNQKSTRIVEYFVNDSVIRSSNLLYTNENIQQEKNRILDIVENMVSSGDINKAFKMVDELSNMYKYDSQILLNKGVVLYLLGNADEAIINLSLCYVLSEDKFESLYNIAIILEDIGQVEMSMQYYKKSYEECKDEDVKKDIKFKIRNYKNEC